MVNKAKQLEWINSHRDYLIKRLNDDFQKPWFPQRLDGSPTNDLADLTYEEVSVRMLQLLYIAKEKRWIDRSLRNLTGDWLRRVEERFSGIETGGEKVSVLQSYDSLDEDPHKVVADFFAEYKKATTAWLAAEDVSYFIAMCQRPGQKPVPFIPVFDENFQVWFKKDSLWQSEDLAAVVDADPQRVLILHGPVAAKHAKKVNEPIRDMLHGVESGLVAKMVEHYYDGNVDKIPEADYLGPQPPSIDAEALIAAHGIKVQHSDTADAKTVTYSLPSGSSATLPAADDWLELLAGPSATWLRALLRTVSVVQDRSYVDNPVSRIMHPRRGQTVELTYDAATGQARSLIARGSARSFGPHDAKFQTVEIARSATTDADPSPTINVTLFEERTAESVPLEFLFRYRPQQPYAPIHEVMEGRNARIRKFYAHVWFGKQGIEAAVTHKQDTKEHVSKPTLLDTANVRRFYSVIGS